MLLFVGAAVTLVGSLGLLRLGSFYERVHAPTLGTTLGTGCIAIASMIYFTVLADPARAARAPDRRFRYCHDTGHSDDSRARGPVSRQVRKYGWRSRPGRGIGPRGGLQGDIEHLPGRRGARGAPKGRRARAGGRGHEGQRDLAAGEDEPVHPPAAERRPALGRGPRRRPPAAARGHAPGHHLRPRQRVRGLRRPRPPSEPRELLPRPAQPLQKGGVENADGRVRRSLPRHCGPEALGRAHLRRLPGRLNGTPRRRPGYRTPREVFKEYLAGPAARP